MFSTGKYWKYTRGKSRYLRCNGILIFKLCGKNLFWFNAMVIFEYTFHPYFDRDCFIFSDIFSNALASIITIGLELKKKKKKYTQCIIGINKVNFDLRYVKEIQIYIWIMNTWNLNNGLEYFIREKLFRGYLHSKIENVLLKHTLQSSVSELKICSPVDRSLVCLVLQGWQRSE